MKPETKMLALALVLVEMLGSAFAGQNPTALQVKAEISRLEQSRKKNPITEKNFAELFSNVGDILRAARDVLGEGHLYLSLEKLGLAEDCCKGRGAERTMGWCRKADLTLTRPSGGR